MKMNRLDEGTTDEREHATFQRWADEDARDEAYRNRADYFYDPYEDDPLNEGATDDGPRRAEKCRTDSRLSGPTTP